VRFPVPLVIDMTDDQLRQWAEATGVPRTGDGSVRAKDAVDAVRAQVLAAVQAVLGQHADISIKR
jgi:hypothetical protein